MSGINRFTGVYLLIGLLQGLVFYYSEQFNRLSNTLIFVVYAVIWVGGTMWQLLGIRASQWRALLPVLVFTTLVGGITLWVSYSAEALGNGRWVIYFWYICLVLLSCISAGFLLARSSARGQLWRYEDVSRHAWNSVLIVLFALILVGVFLLLLMFWNRLFLMVGSEGFEHLFWSELFLCISLPLVFALGMHLGVFNENVVDQIRSILFGACRLLLPLVALISVLLILALPFSGLKPIWATGYATPALLLLAGVQLCLVNGAFQAGGRPGPYPQWLRRYIGASLLCLPILAALAVYSSWLRVEQYGLSPHRFIALLLGGLCGVYGLAAVWAMVLRSPVWLRNLRATNPVLALLFAALLVLMNTPLLDPVQLSVDDQIRRLLDGRTNAEAFDMHYLRFGLQNAGEEAFAKLQADLQQENILNPEARSVLREKVGATELSFFGPDSRE